MSQETKKYRMLGQLFIEAKGRKFHVQNETTWDGGGVVYLYEYAETACYPVGYKKYSDLIGAPNSKQAAWKYCELLAEKKSREEHFEMGN